MQELQPFLKMEHLERTFQAIKSFLLGKCSRQSHRSFGIHVLCLDLFWRLNLVGKKQHFLGASVGPRMFHLHVILVVLGCWEHPSTSLDPEKLTWKLNNYLFEKEKHLPSLHDFGFQFQPSIFVLFFMHLRSWTICLLYFHWTKASQPFIGGVKKVPHFRSF